MAKCETSPATMSAWCERLFGAKLVRCTSSCEDGASDTVQCVDVLDNVDVVAVYFSFANINLQCDEFVRKLRELYGKLNSAEAANGRRKRVEVVQVVLWANNDVYGDFEGSHRECLQGLPWYAMAYSEIELKTRLSRRFRIKSGVPTLVLLENRDGSTISISAQERLLEDPTGSAFPWRPRPVDEVLADIPLQPGGTGSASSAKGEFYKELAGVRGFYFAANWCPPCRAFTPQLVDVYRAIRMRDGYANFEIVFVSSDRSEESYNTNVETMPWLAVPFQQAAIRAELAQLYGIRGIPTLLLLDGNGHLITMDARTELLDDAKALHFPWKPKPVNVLTERYGTKLHDYPSIVLFVDGEDTDIHFAESLLTPIATEYYKTRSINIDQNTDAPLHFHDDYVQFLVAADSDASDVLRDLIGLDDVVPLLVAIDLPRRRFAVMDYTAEVTAVMLQRFVDDYISDQLTYIDINDSLTLIQGAHDACNSKTGVVDVQSED